ncbi:3-hydroxybutyryl-CoA dehydrogenase [Corynebacterium variabile]|uniref:3-hydroxybutyryl-CoA dehydrogenase n=1 Tax=Corynebacterium variabile TaxID=1727 RepID=UPI001D38A2F2|nr:3-hydroxybutyryl-CoA dehydrogenase [Corynebacterium variabile]HJG44834.1 3-hydroxybutyryl-CoA dehydrogenase [Corynebacterium variabile]
MVQRVGVIGAGQMGGGIAEVAAKSGSDVLVWEAKREFLDFGKAKIEKSLAKAVERGKLSEEDRDAALGRLTFTTDLEDFADRELVMEAIIENEDIKKDVFAKLDAIVTDKTAPLCSNTSSLPIQTIASATENPGRVIGLHFFNPVPVLKLVEVIPALTTTGETVETARTYATEVLGKTAILAKDRSGFIVNFLLVPYLLSAIRMVEQGVATKEDIDTGMKLGASHPMGPLTLADMVGLDTCAFIADVMHEEYGDPSYACPPLLRRMVQAGQLGRKSGKGFYDYSA